MILLCSHSDNAFFHIMTYMKLITEKEKMKGLIVCINCLAKGRSACVLEAE